MEQYLFDLEYFPSWTHKSYKSTLQSFWNLTKAITKLRRAITLLEDHSQLGTVPKSLNINIKAQVEKSYQSEVDKEVEEAAKVFQAAVLSSILKARRKELEDKIQARENGVKTFLEEFYTNYTELKNNNIVHDSEEEIKERCERLKNYTVETFQKAEDHIRLEEHFAFKEKQESMRKAQENREEERLNQVLEDPATKALQARLEALEKQVQKVGKIPKATKTSVAKNSSNNKKNPKGKGPPQKQGGGPQKDPEKGNKKPRHASTPTTRPSGSKKKDSQKKQN